MPPSTGSISPGRRSEGLVKHNGPLIDRAGQPVARYRERGVPAAILAYNKIQDLELWSQPSAEAQVAALADDIAYDAHDIDDGLRADLFTLDDIAAVAIVGDILREIDARPPALDPPRRVHETVRRLITRMIEDVIAETSRRAAAHKPTAGELRKAKGPLVEFSPAMKKADADIKGFLYPRMYRHERVMRVMGEAESVVRDLFTHFAGTPADLPAEWAHAAALTDEGARARHIADYIAGMTDRYALVEHAKYFEATPECAEAGAPARACYPRRVMARLVGKVAFITGGGNGIGRATAERFAEEGAKVVIAEIDQKSGEAAAQSARARASNSGGDAHFVPCDVRERASVEAAFAETIGRFGRLDILHNNAGGATPADGPVTEAPEEEFWRAIGLDLFGTFLCSKIGIPHLIKTGGGSIINMSSIVALKALPGRDCYTAAKGAIAALTRSMAVEYAAHKIRVNAIAPRRRAVGTRQETDGGLQGYFQARVEQSAGARPAAPHRRHGGLPCFRGIRDHHRAGIVGR